MPKGKKVCPKCSSKSDGHVSSQSKVFGCEVARIASSTALFAARGNLLSMPVSGDCKVQSQSHTISEALRYNKYLTQCISELVADLKQEIKALEKKKQDFILSEEKQ